MVALILFLDIRLCNWIQDGRVIPWGMITGRWTNRNGESLQSRCQERSCTADVSSSSKKGAMRVSWTQKEEQPVLCEVTNDWIRAQLVIFMRLPSLKTETGWSEGIEMRKWEWDDLAQKVTAVLTFTRWCSSALVSSSSHRSSGTELKSACHWDTKSCLWSGRLRNSWKLVL